MTTKNYKNWIWSQANKYGFQLDALYYYARIMRNLESEIFLVNAIVKYKDTAVDIGANLGLWSYHLAKSFVRVESFEPISEYCDVIRNTRRKNINVHNEALSSCPCTLEVQVPASKDGLLLKSTRSDGTGSQSEKRAVPAKKLDEYSIDRVRLIRINVKGHEIEVLKGAERTIARFRPAMIIRVEQRHLDFPMDKVFDLLKSYRYNAYFLSGRKLRPYGEFSYEIDQLPYLDNPASVAYVCNFICLPQN
jgi:FkbM family methyltransferase